MAQTIELPHVGESVVEGTIGKWLKQPGDRIERYEPLVEVVTDKVTMEVPSPVDGSLVKILAQEGETIPMGAPIAEVETADGSGSAAHPEPAAAPARPDPTAGPTAGPVTPSAGLIGYLNTSAKMVGPTGGGAGDDSLPDPPLQVPAPATQAVAEPGQPSQPHQPGLTASTPAAGAANGSPRLSPAVRRLAREHNIDLSRITGTGMGGRITRDDVLRYLESGAAATATAAVTTAEPAAAQPVTATPAVAGREMKSTLR